MKTSTANAADGSRVSAKGRGLPMKFLKKIREKEGWSAYRMAQHLGLLPQTYIQYEKSAKGIRIKTLCQIRKRLDLTWDQLGKHLEAED